MYIRKTFLEKINHKNIATLPVANVKISGPFKAKQLVIKKQVMVNIEIEQQEISTCLLVIPDLCYDLILGTNWCGDNKIEILYTNQRIKFNNQIVQKSNVVFTEKRKIRKTDNRELILSATMKKNENQINGVIGDNDESFTVNMRDNELRSEIVCEIGEKEKCEISKDKGNNQSETNNIIREINSQNFKKLKSHLPKRVSTIGRGMKRKIKNKTK